MVWWQAVCLGGSFNFIKVRCAMAKKKAVNSRNKKPVVGEKAEKKPVKKPAKRIRNLPAKVMFRNREEMPKMDVRLSPTLSGCVVKLLPLCEDHIIGIEKAARKASIFEFFVDGWLIIKHGVETYVFKLLEEQEKEDALAFAVRDAKNGRVLGVTRLYEVRKRDFKLKVASWYSKDYHQTGVNAEAKYLLLRYVFEAMHCRRVQFDIDIENKPSIRAIESIGAKREGIKEMDMMLANGRQRTSVIYSITEDTWPDSRAKMERKLKRVYAKMGIQGAPFA